MNYSRKKATLSIIVPCFNEEECIELTITTLMDVMTKAAIPFELIFVSDGSKDATFAIIRKHSLADPTHIKGIEFCRNFGKEAAMLAGMRYASGECAVVIDSDLQQPPECIPQMYELWLQGYDIVEGLKTERQKESGLHRLFAGLFYRLFNRAIGMDIGNASDFKLIDRRVIDVLLQLPERERFFRGLTFWTGFKMTTFSYEVKPRQAGTTKWSFVKLIKYALHNIISFSSLPLQLITLLSVIMLLLAVVFGVRALQLYFSGLAAGGITTVVGLILLTGGLILFALSIIGQYIASIYNEIKGRPRYLVGEVAGENMEKKYAATDTQDRFELR